MESTFSRIPTKASLASKESDAESDFQVIVHKKKEKTVKSKERKPEKEGKNDSETSFDIKRARHEVLRFGTSGMATTEKKNAQIALAVKLGAKPPKRPAKSYKEHLQEQRIRKLQATKEKGAGASSKPPQLQNHHQMHPNKLLSSTLQRKRKRNGFQDSIRDYGKVKPDSH